jgi:hypothetical protein
MEKVFGQITWDRKGFITLAILILLAFFVVPISISNPHIHLVLQTCFSLCLLFVIYQISKKPWMTYLGIALMIPFLILDALSTYYDSYYFLIVAYFVYALYILYSIFVISFHVFNIPRTNINLIFGAIVVYLLAGILFGRIFFIIDSVWSPAFKGIESVNIAKSGLESGYETEFNLLYFSLTTLATLGEGDIVPISRFSKVFTILEAMFGQLFVAIVIAKMISAWTGPEEQESS